MEGSLERLLDMSEFWITAAALTVTMHMYSAGFRTPGSVLAAPQKALRWCIAMSQHRSDGHCAKAMQAMHELHVAHFIALREVLSVIALIGTIVLPLLPYKPPHWRTRHKFIVVSYMILLISKRFPVTPWHASTVLGLMQALMFTVTLMIPDASTLHCVYSARLISRFCFALGQLNHRWTAVFAILNSAAHVFKVMELTPDFYARQATMGECFNVMGTWVIFFLVETWLLQRTVAVDDAKESALEQFASSRLLSIFCDAEVMLDQDLVIVRPTRNLSGLLISGTDLVGKAFPSLLDKSDQPRFATFIGESHATCVDVSTVRSLQVTLRDSYGLPLQASLFHVVKAEAGVRTHLIGISVVEEETRGRHHAKASDDNLQQIASIRPRNGTLTQVSKSSSYFCTSDSKSRSSQQSKLVDLPEIEAISVSFDPWDDFAMQELVVSFALPEDPQECSRAQKIKHWLTADSWARVKGWVQGQINAFENAKPGDHLSSSELPNLTARFPGRNQGGPNTLVASQAMLVLR